MKDKIELIEAIENQNYVQAILLLNDLIKECEDDPSLLLTRANVENLMNLKDKSYDTLKQLIQLFPDYAPSYHNLGIYYYRKENFPQAISLFQHAIDIKPDYISLQNLGGL